MTVHKLTLNTLTPIHIGNGLELRKDFEYVVRDGKTYVLNVDAVLDAKYDQIKKTQGHYLTPAALLRPEDYKLSQYFRYILKGTPRSGKTYAEVKAFIKDVYDRPYIPGSSLKGAIRTALAWTGWNEVKPKLDRNAIGRRKSWAGQPLEKKLFGPDPNHDLLRALQISDLLGAYEAGQGLRLINVQVLTGKTPASPVEMEALVGDNIFTGSLTIDNTLFSPWAERKLHLNSRKHWLDELTARVQKHSRARIQDLIPWFEKADAPRIARFYRNLFDAKLSPNQALIQIGWGSGWDGKTFWTHLKQDQYLFERIIQDFRLQRRSRGAPRRKQGDPFPTSKRVVVSVKNGTAIKAAPLGWALLTMEKVK